MRLLYSTSNGQRKRWLLGHMGYDTECWRNCIRLAAAGKLDLNTIVTHQLPLEDWEKGFRMSIDNSAAKVVLIP